MKKLSLILVSALALVAVACGDDDDDGGGSVCEEAADVLLDCDDVEGDGDGSGGECSGDVKAFSECVVKYPEAACQEGSEADQKAYSDCLFAE